MLIQSSHRKSCAASRGPGICHPPHSEPDHRHMTYCIGRRTLSPVHRLHRRPSHVVAAVPVLCAFAVVLRVGPLGTRLPPQPSPPAAGKADLLVRQVLPAYRRCPRPACVATHTPPPMLSQPPQPLAWCHANKGKLTTAGPTGRARQQGLHRPLGPCVVSTATAAGKATVGGGPGNGIG